MPSVAYRLCLIAGVVSACSVYEPGRIAEVPATGTTRGSVMSVPPDSADDEEGPAAEGPSDAGTLCGNGRVDLGEFCDIGLRRGEEGACPMDCDSDDPCVERELLGRACRARCQDTPITQAKAGDGCCPKGIDRDQDDDCGRCGDGVVDPGETCDPPSECPTRASCAGFAQNCIATEYFGSPARCDARCEIVSEAIATCRDGDGCCAPMCSASSDSDCPGQCGNGLIETEAGETCEPGSAAGCDINCDDGNPCTSDVRSGSATNCNVRCTQVPITQPAAGDGCCPQGANAANDGDCMPLCGNGIREVGEQCDGTADCDRNCRRLAPASPRCTAPAPDDACGRCGCLRCAATAFACYAGGDRQRNTQCAQVLACGLGMACVGACAGDLGCFGEQCWFGTGLPTMMPAGPCMTEIGNAAGGGDVVAASQDPAFALYHAERYAACLKTECTSECGLVR